MNFVQGKQSIIILNSLYNRKAERRSVYAITIISPFSYYFVFIVMEEHEMHYMNDR